ncbi:MAG: hypothetical protein JXB08_01665 [Bacilli bacterium]|nr:hypothetical protein [Bacilli bacterium]MBN2877682.1 hypothetical protein [Bacilli bacterium]
MFKKLLKPVNLLIALLIVIVVSSFAASLVQNSFFSVNVSRVTISTDRANGELAGYLYLPNSVDATNPAPAVVLTHGYLNNKEMQEIGAIELSRRGYVVLAIDMYDHGDSTWDTPAAFNFYVYSLYDAVQWIYDQDYVLKDANGNGMIGVSGHSMGGFSSECAAILDEMDFATNGFRKITTVLAVGSDFRYTPFPNPTSYFQTRSVGMIAAHYDQFFFDNDPVVPGQSVVYKDFVSDPVGLAFLGRSDTASAGYYYLVDGGQRVIYTPDETHPNNTWSLESGGYTIEFFERAFTYQLNLSGLNTLDSYGVTTGTTGQVWWLKEGFTLIALLALIALIFPVFSLVSSAPILKKVYPEEAALVPEFKPNRSLSNFLLKGGVVLFGFLLATFVVKSLMDRSAATLDVFVIFNWVVFAVAVAALAGAWLLVLLKKNPFSDIEDVKKFALKVTYYGVALVVVSLAFRWLLVNAATVANPTDHYWSAPSVNTIVFWALGSGGFILLITLLSGFVFNFKSEEKNPFGLKATPIQLVFSLINAVVLVALILFVVAVIGWVFITDFRFYTYAIQIFNSQQFVAAWRYIPLFLVYYFAAGISVFVNTKNVKGWLGDLFAALILAGPVVLFLIIQYVPLFSDGTAFYPTFSLSAILAVGLVPTLSFAAIIMRRFALKTGNIWTGVFFTTMFFTLITLANTVVYLLAVA